MDLTAFCAVDAHELCYGTSGSCGCACHPASECASAFRWACDCGRFIAEASIAERDYRDLGAYYGVATATSYDCSRCGVVERMPRLIEVGERELKAVSP